MATQQALTCITLPAGGDLSADQWKFVTVNSSGQAVLQTTVNGRVVGVLQNDPAAAGREAEVAIAGVVKALVGGTAVAAGDEVEVTAAGLALTAAGAGSNIIGICLVGAAAGGLAEILLQPRGVIPA
jgi:hypothetical protein